ncbi:MAG: class I SAM-dependent methyltransferase [Phototrophicaceae bacterium]
MSIVFDHAAEFYDATRGFPHGVEVEVARAFARAGGLTAQSQLLEVGVGTGRIALPVTALTGAALIGVDLAAPMMHKLRQKQTTEQINLLIGDATQLPLAAHQFDAVIITHVFHLIPNWQDALAEIGRVLKPEGKLLYSWTEHEPDPIWEAWQDSSRTQRFDQFVGTAFFNNSGWQPVGATESVPFQVDRTPIKAIERLQKRYWSNTWAMTDDEISARVEQMRETAAQFQLDLHAERTAGAAFCIATVVRA